MSGFEPQIEEAERKAAEAEDPATRQLYEHHAELLTEVDDVLDAQRELVDRKNESLEALAGLVVSFYREYGEEQEGDAHEDLQRIAVAAQGVIEQVQSESDPLADGVDVESVSGDPEAGGESHSEADGESHFEAGDEPHSGAGDNVEPGDGS